MGVLRSAAIKEALGGSVAGGQDDGRAAAVPLEPGGGETPVGLWRRRSTKLQPISGRRDGGRPRRRRGTRGRDGERRGKAIARRKTEGWVEEI